MMYSQNNISSRSQHSSKYDMDKLRLRKEDSALTKLCELHVYKVPTHLWRDSFNNILNNVVTETISIGIIRVPYDLYLREIRHEIEEQLQADEHIPHEYVFLKSVGRSLTRLRSKQEEVLKAKHFLPPIAIAPELYILEATPEIRDALAISERSSQSSPMSRRTARGYPHSYRNGYRGDSDTDNSHRKSPQSVNKYQALPQIEPAHQQNDRDNRFDPYNRPNDQNNRTNDYDRQNDPYDKRNDPYNKPNDPYNKPNDPYNRKGENYDRPNDPYENRPNDDIKEQRFGGHNPYNRQPHTTKPPQQEFYEAPESQQQEQPETRAVPQAYHAADSSRGRPDERSTSQTQQPRSADKDRRYGDDSGVAGFSPEDEFNRRNRDDYESDMMEEERRRRLEELENRNNLDKNRWDSDEEERKQRAENDRRRREEDERRERERVEEEERRRREENERLRREEEEKRRREEEEKRRRQEEEEIRRRRMEEEEDERRQREEQERRQREQERREEEEQLRNRQIEDVASTPDLQDRDTESAQQRRREEKNQLLRELEEAKRHRQNQEIEREELVRRAKSMQHKTTNRRNEARDMWKKKYFEEKKKTPPMEESRNRSEQELENLHRRLMNTLEGPKDKNFKVTHATPSEKNNYVIQCTKLQHEIEDIQRRVENAKMKLTAEMKLRNQAQGELRALRAELAQRKTSMIASRQQQLANMAYTPKGNQQPAQIPPKTVNSLYGF